MDTHLDSKYIYIHTVSATGICMYIYTVYTADTYLHRQHTYTCTVYTTEQTRRYLTAQERSDRRKNTGKCSKKCCLKISCERGRAVGAAAWIMME
jgi:hypothetical protein